MQYKRYVNSCSFALGCGVSPQSRSSASVAAARAPLHPRAKEKPQQDGPKSKVKSLSRFRLFVTPMDCSLPGSPVHGIFQAIVLEWIAISLSRRGEISFRIKPHTCQRHSEGSNLVCTRTRGPRETDRTVSVC